MNFSALLASAMPIQIHVAAAFAALLLGGAQFLLKRGSVAHRVVGWSWIMVLVVTAMSSFLIHDLRVIGIWSPIHLLSVVTLVTLVFGVRAARQGKYRQHGITMVSLFVLSLLLTGAFTLLPGRLMHSVFFV